MRAVLLVFLVSLFAGVAISGCLGGDDSKPAPKKDDPKAAQAVTTESTGSITGQIVTNDLEVVARADVGLLSGDGTEAARAQTDNQGKFTFNGIEPGSYRIQVAAPCCRVGIAEVVVEAGKVTPANFQLARLTADDLQVPYVESNEWHGFIACGIGTAVLLWATCSELEGTPVEDPNEDFYEIVNVSKGIRAFAVGINWDPVGGLSGGELALYVEKLGCGLTCAGEDTYAALSGPPPLVKVVNDEDAPALWKWSAVGDEGRQIQYRVFASGTATVMYQQPFAVYWDAYYWQPAPPEANPIPDQ